MGAKDVKPKKHNSFSLSSIFFCWTFPFFLKGFRNELNEKDLVDPILEHDSEFLGDQLEDAWDCTHSLWKSIWKIFGREILAYGVLVMFIEFFIRLLQPISLWKLTLYYSPTKTDITQDEAYCYAIIIVLSTFMNVLFYHSYLFGLQRLGMKIRIALCSLIYRKCLKLRSTTTNKSRAGQVVNLLSNDVNRFDKVLVHIHYLWAAPLETAIITYLLYVMLSPIAVAGCIIFLIFLPIQMMTGNVWSQFRAKTAVRTDHRARLLNEIISGIHVIKMYNWEELFQNLMEHARKNEIKYIRYTSYLKAFHSSFGKYATRTAVFLSVLAYGLTGHHIEAQYIFVVKSFYTILKESVTTNFPLAVSGLAEAAVSLSRIRKFLMDEEVIQSIKPKEIIRKNSTTLYKFYDIGVEMEQVSGKWVDNDILKSINFSVSQNQFVGVVGPVGCGKTSLLKAILGEMPLAGGKRSVVGTISYASQEPWLFSGTIQSNILFGQEMDLVRYSEVLRVCALDYDLARLPCGDLCEISDRGVTLSGGQKARISLARAIYKNADIYLLDDPLSAVDSFVAKHLFEECILRYLKGKCVVLITHQLQYLNQIDFIYLMENGNIEVSGNYETIKSCGNEFTQLLKDKADKVEENDNIDDDSTEGRWSKDSEPVHDEEKYNIGAVSSRVYWEYLLSGGSCKFVIVIMLFVLTQAICSCSDYFEAFWVNAEEKRIRSKTVDDVETTFFTAQNCMYIYSGLIGAIILFTILRSVSFFLYFIKVSTRLHSRMFTSIIKASLTFFSANPTGRILNRFCKDLGAIDETLPAVLMDTIQIGLNVLAITLVIGIVNPWISFATIGILIIFYTFRNFYLITSRDVKRMEATTRSPVFSHTSSTLQGLATIRASGNKNKLKRQFDLYQNHHTSAYYMFMSCTATFGFWLDMFCATYIALVATSCFWKQDNEGGNVGLLITQAFGLTGMFQWGMKQWSELENQMTSVERAIEYADLPAEGSEIAGEPPADWPRNCDIAFNSVSLRYRKNEGLVLDHLNFRIEPKEKIGVIGRTGAGKTSLISALFRLVDFDGAIYIDRVNTRYLTLGHLRSRISIIPQEPVLFSGTIRENLDPFGQYGDQKIWQTLELLELKEFVNSLSDGLSTKLERGACLSIGQRQLFCLARALLKDNKILIMDEATANLDYKTDALIQSTIKQQFIDCTVVIIAHRLHTIMECDKVLVMDAGRVVEFDHPYKLLKEKDGVLRGFVMRSGQYTANSLIEIAEKNYLQRLKQ